MPKDLNENRILSIFLTIIFIVILIALLVEIQKPSCNSKGIGNYTTSYLILQNADINQMIVFKAIIFSLTIMFPVFTGVNIFLKGKIEETSNWFLMALLILIAAGIYLTFLI